MEYVHMHYIKEGSRKKTRFFYYTIQFGEQATIFIENIIRSFEMF